MLEEKNDLITTANVSIAGTNMEAQYAVTNALGVAAAMHGENRTYSDFSARQFHRSAWTGTLAGMYFLRPWKNSEFNFPLMLGLNTGGVNQSNQANNNESNYFSGNYTGYYYQLGAQMIVDWFQIYLGIQQQNLHYRNIKSDVLQAPIHFQLTQITGQMTFRIRNHYWIRTFGSINATSSGNFSRGAYESVYPALNLGVGFGVNLNKDPIRIKNEAK